MKIPYLSENSIPVVAFVLLLTGTPAIHAEFSINPSSSSPDVNKPAKVTDGPLTKTGKSNVEYLSRTAWDVHPVNSDITYAISNDIDGGQGIYRTGGDFWFKVPVHLSSGSRIEAVEFNYCDTGEGDFRAFLFVQPKNGAPSLTRLLQSADTPGCVVETAILASPITVDNDANSYHIELIFPVANDSLLFGSLRVAFRRQISPAPATATFNDVPTDHALFRAVEAVADAGISGGCGDGNFCPGDAVTRGELAVFLARALGLHWSP